MSAGDTVFTDTNVIVYSVDPRVPEKMTRADQWLSALWVHDAGRLSWQVLHEFYATVTRKFGLPAEHARISVRALLMWRPVEMTPTLLDRAWSWSDSAQLSYWDALIVAAAEVAECRWLLSEDLQHGRVFGNVTVVDPFRTEPEELGFPPPAE